MTTNQDNIFLFCHRCNICYDFRNHYGCITQNCVEVNCVIYQELLARNLRSLSNPRIASPHQQIVDWKRTLLETAPGLGIILSLKDYTMTKHHEALPRPGQGGTAATALVSLACVAPSACINVMHALAHTPRPLALPLAAASVLSVAQAAASPFAIEKAVATRNAALLLVALLTGGVCLTYNLAAAVGAASTTRAEITGSRTAENSKAALLTGQLAQAEKSRAALALISQETTPGMVEAELRGLEQSPAWTSSKQCTDATLPASRSFCADHAAKQAALNASRKVGALDREIVATKAKLLAGNGQATGQPADVQAANIAAALSFIVGHAEAGTIGIALNLWLAVLVEVLGAFGPLVFAAALRRQPQPVAAMVAESAETAAAPVTPKPGKKKKAKPQPRKRSKMTATAEPRNNVVPLHERPRAVADLKAAGKSQREIARTLRLSRASVPRALNETGKTAS